MARPGGQGEGKKGRHRGGGGRRTAAGRGPVHRCLQRHPWAMPSRKSNGQLRAYLPRGADPTGDPDWGAPPPKHHGGGSTKRGRPRNDVAEVKESAQKGGMVLRGGVSGEFPGSGEASAVLLPLLEADGLRLVIDMGATARLASWQRHARCSAWTRRRDQSTCQRRPLRRTVSYAIERTYAAEGKKPPIPGLRAAGTRERIGSSTAQGRRQTGRRSGSRSRRLATGPDADRAVDVTPRTEPHGSRTFGFTVLPRRPDARLTPGTRPDRAVWAGPAAATVPSEAAFLDGL